MNFTPKPNYKVIWRQEASELAYAIAREAQMQDAVREPFSYGGSKAIYEALLLASTEMPAEVGQLCLELADRRDLDPAIAAKAAEAQAKRMVERKEAEATAPKRKSLPRSISMLGPLRKPWPDGPRSRVDRKFVEACLDGNSYGAFVKANSDAALEVLLSVCIEEPKHKQYGSSSLDELGLSYWQAGNPAIWFRGPFFALLTAAPEHGLTFVIKLTNFATERYEHSDGETFKIGGKKKRWRGDSNVFTWHYDRHMINGSILQCALMALEKWMYDRIDAEEDITPAVSRIMNESESLAFAGLLLTVAKKKPDLLTGPLSPLLESWVLVEWESQFTNQRNRGLRGGLGYWGSQPQEAIKIAQDWTSMPHRKIAICNLLGRDLLPLREHDKFFDRLLAAWEKHLSKDRKPIQLRRLIESLRKSNYKFGVVDGKTVPIEFMAPVEDEAEDIALSQKASESLQFITLPIQCRQVLDAGTPINTDQVEPLADLINSIHKKGDDKNDDATHTAQDVVLAGVAVLICLHYDWLVAHPTRLAWCRKRLEEAVNTIGTRPRFYSDTNHGNDKWDAFAAECGVLLLARDRTDPLARKLVAQAITGHFYSTTQLVVNRAVRNHIALGDDFKCVIAAVLEWSAIRPLINPSLSQLTAETQQGDKRKTALEKRFVDSTLKPVMPDLKKLNADARKKLDDIYAKRHPDHAAFLKSKAWQRNASGSRIELHPDRPGFDVRLVSAALSWLRPDVVSSFSRLEIIAIIKTLLGIVLASVPQITDHKTEEITGLPSEFDSWVYELVATAIPLLAPAEKPKQLWQPILNLGAPAHDWVERFYWQWFTLGSKAKADFADFFREWRAMIEFALASPQWDYKMNWHHAMDDMVFELLGFNPGWAVWINTDGVAPFVDGMSDLYERGAAKWFSLPKVLSGFVRFAQHAAASDLAIKSIPWIAAAVRNYDKYDWRYGTEENLIEFLGTYWQRDAKKITEHTALRTVFFEIVKILAARGSHAALALQDRVSSQTFG